VTEELHRALLEVNRLTRNPKKVVQRRRQVLEGHLREREDSNKPTGFLTLLGEEWSPPGLGPRNLNMLDRNGNEHKSSCGQKHEQKDFEKSC